MLLTDVISHQLGLLADTLRQLSPAEYAGGAEALSGATIGRHVRHVIDMFQCLETAYDGGVLNYEHRLRDPRTELDPAFAVSRINSMLKALDRPDKQLELHPGFDLPGPASIPTNYYRELVYNLEHTIHHMALIKIGIREKTRLSVPPEFGIAPSTLKYQASCAQ